MSTRRRAPLGRLSRRDLAFDASSVAALDENVRAAVVATWMRRAGGEQQAAASFEKIADDLRRTNASDDLCDVALRAIDDERRHAEICRRVASHYAGTDLPVPDVPPASIPAYLAAPEEMRPVLRIIAMCCINETTATAFFESALASATLPAVRSALRELLGDDIDHARIGWLYLDRLRSRALLDRSLEPWLLTITRANLGAWRDSRVPLSHPELPAHGCPDGESMERAITGAVRDLIVPGFARAGFDVSAMHRWIAAGMVS